MQEKNQPKTRAEQAKALREAMLEHERKKATNEEYRKRSKEFKKRLIHFGDDTED